MWPQGVGSRAGRGLYSSRPRGLSSLPAELGMGTGRPASQPPAPRGPGEEVQGGGARFLLALSGLWAHPHPRLSSLSLSPSYPHLLLCLSLSFIFPPLPHLLSQLPAEGQVTLFPVALHFSVSRASGSLHRGQPDRKAFQGKASQTQSPGRQWPWCSWCWFPDPDCPPVWTTSVMASAYAVCWERVAGQSRPHCLQVGLCFSLPA